MDCSCNSNQCSGGRNNQFNKLRQCWSNHLKNCLQEEQNGDCGCCPPPRCKPKVKGTFGVAYMIEHPAVKNEGCGNKKVKPCGWQIEFNDTPSKVEYNCEKMLNWVTCPPLECPNAIVGSCKNNETSICYCAPQPPCCCKNISPPKCCQCINVAVKTKECCCQSNKDNKPCQCCCQKTCCCDKNQNVSECCCCSKKEATKCRCCQPVSDKDCCCQIKEKKLCCCCKPSEKKRVKCAQCCCVISEKKSDNFCCLCSKKIDKKKKPCCCQSYSSSESCPSESDQCCCNKKNTKKKCCCTSKEMPTKSSKERSKHEKSKERNRNNESREKKQKKEKPRGKSKSHDEEDEKSDTEPDVKKPQKLDKSKNQGHLRPKQHENIEKVGKNDADEHYKELTEKIKNIHEKHENLRQIKQNPVEQLKKREETNIELTKKSDDILQKQEEQKNSNNTQNEHQDSVIHTAKTEENDKNQQQEEEKLYEEVPNDLKPDSMEIKDQINSVETVLNEEDENNSIQNQTAHSLENDKEAEITSVNYQELQNNEDVNKIDVEEKQVKKRQGPSLLKKIRKEHKKEMDMIHQTEAELKHQHPIRAT